MSKQFSSFSEQRLIFGICGIEPGCFSCKAFAHAGKCVRLHARVDIGDIRMRTVHGLHAIVALLFFLFSFRF